MNKKGFTIVELLAVLIILSLIAVIIYPNIIRSVRSTKNDLSNIQINNIKESAKMYVNDNVGTDNFFDSNNEEVSLKKLVDDGYIDGSTYDILNNKEYNLVNSKVIITRTGEYPNYVYEYNLDLHDN